MGRFGEGTKSEEFHDAMRDAGAVECTVCGQKIQWNGKEGKAINVCIECLEYVCDNHFYRHPKCSQGR